MVASGDRKSKIKNRTSKIASVARYSLLLPQQFQALPVVGDGVQSCFQLLLDG
jgi:hypothetical protein